MLTLYYLPTCSFCRKVLAVAEDFNIVLEKLDISASGVAADLIKRGGKRQVPYLVDNEHGVGMYESDDINAYLREHCAKVR